MRHDSTRQIVNASPSNPRKLDEATSDGRLNEIKEVQNQGA